MKALTISQPYASLIATGEKFIENRTWRSYYRGPLAIHAGKGSRYLTAAEMRGYPTGCVVAVAELVTCLPVDEIEQRIKASRPPTPYLSMSDLRKILRHKHTEGPVAWVLRNVRPLREPVPACGAQGLWTLDDTLLAGVKIDETPHPAFTEPNASPF